MTTKADHIIKGVLGRMADEAPPSLDLEELGSPVIERALPPAMRRRPAMVGAGLGAAVVVFLAILLTLEPVRDGATPVGAATPASVAEITAAIEDGFATLRGADGVVGTHDAYEDGVLDNRIWFTTRPDGSRVFVGQTGSGVAASVGRTDSSTPADVGGGQPVFVWLSLGDIAYEATDTSPWAISRGSFSMSPIQPLLGAEVNTLPIDPGAEVTRQRTADGGTLWTLQNESSVHRMHIHPDGYLARWEFDLTEVETSWKGFDAAIIQYRPLDDAEPIPAPVVGTPLDLASFDLPAGFDTGEN